MVCVERVGPIYFRVCFEKINLQVEVEPNVKRKWICLHNRGSQKMNWFGRIQIEHPGGLMSFLTKPPRHFFQRLAIKERRVSWEAENAILSAWKIAVSLVLSPGRAGQSSCSYYGHTDTAYLVLNYFLQFQPEF